MRIIGQMDALLIGPVLAVTFAATMFAGKAVLWALITAMQRSSLRD